jgi:hypothetical protein
MPTLKSRDLLLRTALGLLLLSGCAGSGGRSGADTADDWILGGAAEAGFDPAALERLVLDIEAGMFPNTHALLIEHDGALVFERDLDASRDRPGRRFWRSCGPPCHRPFDGPSCRGDRRLE